MTYLDFISLNELMKQKTREKCHIDKVTKEGVVLSYNDDTNFFDRVQFINLLNNLTFYFSNPSILRNFDFNLNQSIILYHGSIGGIKGKIDVKYSNNLCDFGGGFYLGENMMQALNRICNSKNPILYTFKLFEKDQSIYTFDDDLLWTLYIARNRKKYDFSSYTNLENKFNFIDSHDIIIGLIADDKISDVYESFLDKYINSKVLSESLKLVKYGRQIVIKNQKYVSSRYLKQIDKSILTKKERKASQEWGRSIKNNMDSNLEAIITKYRRSPDGLYFDEILDMIKRGKLYD